VLENLLTNAYKFTPRGTVTLQVRRGTDDETPIVEWSVLDNGIGIPRDRQEAIFDEFQQVDGSSTRLYGGTGLGLALSRGLARLLGGRITVQSEPGRGSRFTLGVPERTELTALSRSCHRVIVQLRIASPSCVEPRSTRFGHGTRPRHGVRREDVVQLLLAEPPLFEHQLVDAAVRLERLAGDGGGAIVADVRHERRDDADAALEQCADVVTVRLDAEDAALAQHDGTACVSISTDWKMLNAMTGSNTLS
jgi:anti-sigma regulatory factor (Ser/Thr protein kinase)